MNVLHLPYCYHPDPVGGTEVYVEALARELRGLGVESVVAAPGDRDRAYEHEGLPVRRFAVSARIGDPCELYGEGDPLAAAGFARVLDDMRPDIVHLHAFTRGVSLRLLREARRRGIPTVFTYHTPTVSCQRGTLMRWGTQPCDGALDSARCTACTLHGHGAPRPLAIGLGRIPPGFGGALAAAGLRGGVWTALRMSELVRLRHGVFRDLMAEVDRVVVLGEWSRAVLARNGVPTEKMILVRHGLPSASSASPSGPPSQPAGPPPLRVAFLGRLDPTKGPDLLVRAVRRLPQLDVRVDCYGIPQGESGQAYQQRLRALAGDDRRFQFRSPVPGERVPSLLGAYHLVAVPSRCLETGPLAVLEAFAAGVPVLGARLGGIAELVEHEVNGLLVEPDSEAAWADALHRAAREPGLLDRLRDGIRPPRAASEVAREMLDVYRHVLGSPSSVHSGSIGRF